MLDFDQAEMYGIETKHLKRAVRRNPERFEGDDFMFELTKEEFSILRYQFGTSSWGGSRYTPFVFTDYNDINEDTRMQLELINETLAQLQTDRKLSDKSRNRIGYVKPG